MKRQLGTAALALGMMMLGAAYAANPREAVGFFGNLTGTVQSAQDDGAGFVIKVSAAEAGKGNKVEDTSVLVGKELTIGVRMPKKDGKAAPHVDDVAYVKTLNPGMKITVNIFAVNAEPSVLRITKPGEAATQPAKAASTQEK